MIAFWNNVFYEGRRKYLQLKAGSRAGHCIHMCDHFTRQVVKPGMQDSRSTSASQPSDTQGPTMYPLQSLRSSLVSPSQNSFFLSRPLSRPLDHVESSSHLFPFSSLSHWCPISLPLLSHEPTSTWSLPACFRTSQILGPSHSQSILDMSKCVSLNPRREADSANLIYGPISTHVARIGITVQLAINTGVKSELDRRRQTWIGVQFLNKRYVKGEIKWKRGIQIKQKKSA